MGAYVTSAGGNARITVLENNAYKVTYYTVITGTSGTLTLPTGATLNAGEFAGQNSIISEVDGAGKPTYITPRTAGGVIVTSTLATDTGTWTTSAAYSEASIALIYSIKITALNYSNLTYANILETVQDFNVIVSGGFPVTLTATAQTNITLPTTGTLYGTKTGSVTSAQLLNTLSDATGTGVAVFGTSPTFTTQITSPVIYGSSAASGSLTLDSTSNATKGPIQIGTTSIVNIGNAVTTNQRLVRIGQDTAYMDMGSLVGATSYAAIYFDQATPSSTNYGFLGNSTTTQFNATTTIGFNLNDVTKLTLNSSGFTFTDGQNIIFGSTTGTKLGGIGAKLSLYGATAILQPTTAIAASTFVANTSGIVNDTATWDGYTIGQIVKALRNLGALA